MPAVVGAKQYFKDLSPVPPFWFAAAIQIANFIQMKGRGCFPSSEACFLAFAGLLFAPLLFAPLCFSFLVCFRTSERLLLCLR